MTDITITIPNNKIDEFKIGFLKVYPKPDGVTDLQHIKNFLREQLLKYYKTGKILIARENMDLDLDLNLIEV